MRLLQTGLCAIALALPAAASAQTEESDRIDESTMHPMPDHQTGEHQAAKTTGERKELTLTPEEARLVLQLHHVNQMEIEAGKLAASKAEGAKVRQYGNRLVRDHKADDQRVTTFAKQRDLSLESAAQAQSPDQRAAMQKHQALMQKLDAATGKQFDDAFLTAMANGHEEVISSVRAASTQVQDPQLRALVDRLLPQLEQHRASAKRLLESE